MGQQGLSRNITGLSIFIVGVAFLLSALNIISFENLFSELWPVLIILSGLIILVNNMRSWPVGLFLVALGTMYQFQQLDVIQVDPWSVVWSLAVIFIGISVLTGRSYTGKRFSKDERDDVTAILSGTNVTNHSKSFKQSNTTAIMGGARLDLREADIDKHAVVDLFTFWGGVEIIVPSNVVIRNQVNNIMAGTEDKSHQKTTKDSPVLVIAGTAIMGGVSIRNTPSD